MAEEMTLGEEVTAHQRGEERDRVVAEMKAVSIVERLEVVEVAIAEDAYLVAVASWLGA